MPALLRFALVIALLLASAPSFAAPSPLAHADGVSDPVRIFPDFPCADQDVRLIFTYCTCNVHVAGFHRTNVNNARIDVVVDTSIVCVQCAPDTVGFDLGRFPVGRHRFLTQVVSRVSGPDSSMTHTDYYVSEFEVRAECGPSGPLPFLTAVNIGIDAPCVDCPPRICAFDTSQVYLHGLFNDASYALAEVTFIPDDYSPIPVPPRVRLLFSKTCSGPAVLTPWSTTFAIPPLLPGSNHLYIEEFLRDDCQPGNLISLGSATFPIAVQDCRTTGNCYLASFVRQPGACDANVTPASPAFTVLGINSGRAIGGVQGRLVFDRPGMHVQSIEPAYAGSILKWDRTPDGANFVIVVPPDSMPPSPPDVLRPLLFVNVALDGVRVDGDGVVRLTPVDLLVSDPTGAEIPHCISVVTTVLDPSARICTQAGCDFNGDGRTDVRDIVVMVRCLLYPDPNVRCPETPDCDADGEHDLDDVLCCARRILHGAPPDSAGSVPAPEVSVAFGAPVAVAGGIDVPVTLYGSDHVFATRLEFEYPDGAFASASVELTDHPANWLGLAEASAGRALFGGIQLAPDHSESLVGPLKLTLHLVSRAGVAPAGTVAFARGDFSNVNGAMLATSARPVSVPLGGGGNVALRAARPNPFGAETHFAVGLARAADLVVGIYDLAGRRVATLFKGRAAAGTREFTWRRTRDDGSLVPSGMYFYRIVSGRETTGGKVLVLARD
jgi:hypothetical protein